MGYACPVCDSPQADGEHLANHLAFAAMLHGGAHEAWLDERVPDWADRDPDGLAAAVTGHAEETDHETVFEDTAGDRPDVGLGRAHGRGHEHEQSYRHGEASSPGELDPETRRIVEEAMEMTQQRRTGDGRDRSDGGSEE